MIGFFAGTYLFTWVIWEAYSMMYGFSDVIFVFDWLTGGLALLAAMICSVGTTVLLLLPRSFRGSGRADQTEAPAAGKRILLERVTFIWKRLKFLHKVQRANIFRYKKRFFMMVLGICGCTALLVTGLGIKDSIKNVVDIQYGEIYHVDFTVTFNKAMDAETEEEFLADCPDAVEDALSCTPARRKRVRVRASNPLTWWPAPTRTRSLTLSTLHNADGPLDYPQAGEGIINTGLADDLELAVGDDITVYDSEQHELTVTISGICDNYVTITLYKRRYLCGKLRRDERKLGLCDRA